MVTVLKIVTTFSRFKSQNSQNYLVCFVGHRFRPTVDEVGFERVFNIQDIVRLERIRTYQYVEHFTIHGFHPPAQGYPVVGNTEQESENYESSVNSDSN